MAAVDKRGGGGSSESLGQPLFTPKDGKVSILMPDEAAPVHSG